ncbi:procollagen-lysine,2-oxoglutarate 5-dioxygenase [Malaya genurostris]|uniref:procollagen-lysine,2-oxoglutarate 5-dioxygenase n=1 Tax=Malaya genurostris TaxID=325434 RepID=UPI0026F39BCA|nr:procollagen-lysine,2-oxoglutarate 5-dioxygenase [Malaya genurostris]
MSCRTVVVQFVIVLIIALCRRCVGEDKKPLVFTVASNETEGYKRYIRSANHYGIEVTTLGLGKQWLGGDMKRLGGGYKINLFRDALKPYKMEDDRIVLFTDSYDVLFLASIEKIVETFKTLEASVLFGSEGYCWPDEELKSKYPKLEGRGTRFLNSGMFIGYASKVYQMLKTPVKDTDDDQLYYTKVYLNKQIREDLNIKLDHTALLFQNLNGVEEQVILALNADNKEVYLKNTEYSTVPLVLHGNGPSKLTLNGFANYLAGAFIDGECKTVTENLLQLDEENLPTVMLALFIEKATPFIDDWFDKIANLNYPMSKMHLFIHNNVLYHKASIDRFIASYKDKYQSFRMVDYNEDFEELSGRSLAAHQCLKRKCDYLFVVDSDGHIDLPDTLRKLITLNRNIVSPMINRPEKVWSNFWGALSAQGFYARSTDYIDIVGQKVIGIWNVPYISTVYLVKAAVLPDVNYELPNTDPDMAFCWHMRSKGVFMHIVNTKNFGHLIDAEYYDSNRTHPDFYQLFNNKYDWEQKYISKEYYKQLKDDFVPHQPCPDVYWFAVGSETFCDHLKDIVENFGQWSDGTNNDKRLQGGYEAVPTRDIHMNQVGLEQVWLKFLQLYVRPLQEKVFIGYFHDPPRSLMNFVVRYKPDEQPSLRPHHDSSTYTINIALNNAGIDYEGGGCKFLRYNCSVKDTRKGWMLMHPGRLTHFHEGLTTTNGTRYIMISFIDP